MGEDDTKVAVEPSANGTSSLQKAPDAEAQGGEETHELKKDEDAGPEKMEIDAEIKQHEEKDKKLETEKTDDKADQMDEDNKVKADDGVSGEEDTVMKENMESDDKKDIKEGAGNQGMAKVATTQERTEKESEDGGKLNGDKQGNKEDIKEEDKVVGGDEGENNKDEEPKEKNEIQLAEDGKEKETNKQGEEEEEHVEADAEPKVEDEKAESKGGNENEIDESKDEKEDEKEETMDDKEDEKEESNHDKNEDTNKSNKRGKGKTDKVRGNTKSEEDKKDIEPRTPFSDRPVRERKSVERLVALVDKDSSKEFQVAKGKGTPLKDIPNVAYKLSRKKSDEVLKLLHTILFGGRRGKAAQIRTNILRFSGYTWQGDEEDIVAKLFEFLEKPHATTDVLIYEKEKGAKRKRTPKKSSPAAGSSSSKRSSKVPEI
ncbi:unnamed protein product [Arabis nemorensis]|uniref:DEK C-terminal domain-containing protein n=1 Tax=Arabis nemorensis TaxID=586526 RepID=A0A565CQV7_9BRAS|nr:unnamed protein product [Arabis nemorensis]